MPTLSHSDDEMWVYQQHTRAKHEILKYYSTVWTKIVSDDWRTLRFFDCFAGRGDYVNSDGAEPIELDSIETDANYPGSPQIFLDRATKFSHLFDKAECYFFEPDDTNREHLRRNLANTEGIATNVEPKIIDEEFADGIEDVIMESGGYGGFGLFFIDPFGLSAIPYDKISTVTGTDKFDAIITLMTSELIRWRDSDGHENMHEIVYGTPDWKDELLNVDVDDPIYAEAEYYSKRLNEGGTTHALPYLLTEGDNRRLKYHLVFTSNDERGFTAIRDAMMYCGTKYTLAFAPEHPDFHQDHQTRLGNQGILTESERAKAYLMTKFAGRSITFDDLVTVSYIDRPKAKSVRKHYRQYLIEMDNNDEIEIPQRKDETDPLKPDYVIQFPNGE